MTDILQYKHSTPFFPSTARIHEKYFRIVEIKLFTRLPKEQHVGEQADH